MTSEQAAYSAGFFDGEGSVGIYQRKAGDCTLRLSVGSTDHTIIDDLRRWFGVGHSWSFTDRKSRKNSLKVLGASGRKACEIIRKILPFLRVKKRQAELALAFHTCPWRGQTGPPGRNAWQRRIDTWFSRESKRLKQVSYASESDE